MAETALVILNHTLMDLVSVSIVYLLLSEVFRRNGAPVLWYAYFLVKAIVDIIIQHPGVHGVLAESLRSFSWLWFAFTSIASFVVICLSFKSDYVLVCVYFINGARGFWAGFWQGFVILSIMNLIDRFLVDDYWVGHTNAWIIPGTEDLRPYITAKDKKQKWIMGTAGMAIVAALLSGVMTLIL